VDSDRTVQEARDLIDQIDAVLTIAPNREQLLKLETQINQIQAADPAHPWLSYLLGRTYAFAGKNGDAIDQLRKFVGTRDGRNDWKAYRVLGDMYVTEFPRLAKASYEKAAELMPNEPSVISGLSNCASRAGNLDEGIRLARLAAEADGYKNVRYSYLLAWALINRQQWDDAQKAADKSMAVAEQLIQTEPGKRVHWQILLEQYALHVEIMRGRINAQTTVDPQMYIRLVDLLGHQTDVVSRLARHDQAALLQAAVEKTAPDTPLVLRLRFAETLSEARRTDEAITEYEKVLAVEPGNRAASDALAQLRNSTTKAPN